MKLEVLTITNFKGIKSFVLKADGKNCSILGDNATGKTTIADALSWLLFDQDSTGAALQPKALEASGEAIHGVSSDVEAVFDDITLKKSFAEKWTKAKGKANKEFTGHTIDYYVDGVPAMKKEYIEMLEKIAPIKTLKLLTEISGFSKKLHWQDRRTILLDICGDISDTDIIASDKTLSSIPKILNDKTFDERKKIILSQKTKINKELNELPVRIDEANKGLPDMTDIGIDIASMQTEQALLQKQLTAAGEKKVRIESGGEVAEKNKTLRILETKLLKIENQKTVIRYQTEEDQRKERQKLQITIDVEKTNRTKLYFTIEKNIEKNRVANDAMKTLRQKWHKINKTIFTSGSCPTCGQDYPPEQAKQIKANFNTNKSKELADINKAGKTWTAEILEREEASEMFEADIVTYNKSIEKLEAQIKAFSLDEKVNPNPHETKLKRDIEKLKVELKELSSNSLESLQKTQLEIDGIVEEMGIFGTTKQTIKTYTDGKERIGVLMNQQKTCAAEFEKLEKKLFIMEEFIRAKVALLEGKINDKFKLAKFKLFDEQVNGELSECCEVLYQGIPYNSGLNNSARINVGLDIINTLAEYYGFTMPVFIDNAESIIKIIWSPSQIIRLIVDENYQQLTKKEKGHTSPIETLRPF